MIHMNINTSFSRVSCNMAQSALREEGWSGWKVQALSAFNQCTFNHVFDTSTCLLLFRSELCSINNTTALY